MAQPIQTRLRLLFTAAGKDVSQSLLPDLLSFDYTDKETNEAEEISITLKDNTGRWAGTWKPESGEVVRAYIRQGQTKGKNGYELYCGTFFVDSLRVSGSPRTFELRAVSIPLNTPIRRKMKTRAWAKVRLQDIATKIARENKVKLLYDAAENPSFDRQDQDKESDLKFLSRLCEDAGLSLKVTNETLIVFDQASYEKKAAVKTFTLGKSDILSWDFESQKSETYKTCTVTYRDPKKKIRGKAGGYDMGSGQSKKSGNPAVASYSYHDPEAEDSDQEYVVKKRAKSVDEAKRIARATLRKLNRRKVTGSLTVIGDTTLVAGVVIGCRGFGSFDGNFIIEEAAHSVSTSGYTTAIRLRRVNSNY